MKVGNWYYLTGRHTRSDRKYKDVTIEANYNGFQLVDKDAHKFLEVIMTDEEIDVFISRLQQIKKYKDAKWQD